MGLPTRNIQLDFFRGLALMVIFINHTPDNPWFSYTPSRFGISDAAEVFVFLSGFASVSYFVFQADTEALQPVEALSSETEADKLIDSRQPL